MRDVTQEEVKIFKVIMCHCIVCVTDAGAVVSQAPPFTSLCSSVHTTQSVEFKSVTNRQ